MKKIILMTGLVLATTQVYSQAPEYCGDNVRNMSYYANILIKETNLLGNKDIARKALTKFNKLSDEYALDCKEHKGYTDNVYNAAKISTNAEKRLK